MRIQESLSSPTDELNPFARKQLERARNAAIIRGDRIGAVEMQGKLLGLRKLSFPEGAPRIWSTANIAGHHIGNPYQELNVRHADFMRSRLDDIARVPLLGRELLERAGVQTADIPSADDVLEAVKAQTAVNEVGRYYTDNGGVAYRTPTGDYESFRMPSDDAGVQAIMDSFRAAAYQEFTDGTLQLVITNNSGRNQAAFEAIR